MESHSDKTDVDRLCTEGDDEFRAQRYRRALNHYETALKFGEAQMSTDRRIDVRMTTAVCCFHLQYYRDAERYDRATLKILEASKYYGTDHGDTVRTRYNLGRALASTSKSDQRANRQWKEAVSLYKKNLAVGRVADKDLLLKTRKSLASVLVKLCRYLEAKRLYEQLLDEDEVGFLDGEDDESLELKHEYAAVLYHVRRYEKSKRLFLQIQATISPLLKLRKRKLEKLSQDVDRYLAACFEATYDLDMGVARAVAAATARKNSSPDPIKHSATGSTLRQSRTPRPSLDVVGRKTGESKQPFWPSDDESASVTPERHTASTQTVRLRNNIRGAASSARRRSSESSQISSSPASAGSPASTPNLSVSLSNIPKTRRTKSDQSVGRSRETTQSHLPVVRSRSARSSSRSTHLSESESKTKSAASLGSKRIGLKETASRKENSDGEKESSRSRPNRNVSDPSSRAISSVKRVSLIQSPESPSNCLRTQIKTSQVPQIKIHLPGSWSEEFPSRSKNVQQTKDLIAAQPKNKQRSLDGDTVSLISSAPKAARRNSDSTASETGKLFDLPSSANEADRWFHELRKHTHTLLYNGTPKNPGRKPVRVAVLDSGLATDHHGVKVPMARLGRRKIKLGQVTYKDFTGCSPSRTDSNEKLHGTWCASVLMQVAPEAELYIANVVQPNKEGQKAEHVAAAIAWAIEEEVNIISISFGWESEKSEVDEQIDRARQKGIHLFAAASNDGDFTPEHGMYPASHHSVYSIYSCRGSGRSSDFNPRPIRDAFNFMFPGEDLTILERDHTPVSGIGRQKGTSFATPIAAGTAALVLDLVRHELKDSEEMESRLRKYKGMSNIFRAMSGDPRDGGYYNVRPWTLLGADKPPVSPHVNETHQWYTLVNVYRHLQEFGRYERPLS